MTAAELIAELSRFDPTTLVVVETDRGVEPLADDFKRSICVVHDKGETYRCVVLQSTSWPYSRRILSL